VHGGSERRPKKLALGVLLVITTATLSFGVLIKKPCVIERFGDAFQLCYSDVQYLYTAEELDRGRIPYVDNCSSDKAVCDEYPVVTMFVMKLAATVEHTPDGFWFLAVGLLALAALGTLVLLYRMIGARALLFALSPALFLYAFMSWDLLAVILVAAALFAFLKDRPVLCGVLLGLGAATKLYPALVLIPFAAELIHRRRPKAVRDMIVAAGASFAIVNAPFATSHFHSWFTFFRFNSGRPADYDSLWYVACRAFHHQTTCPWSSSAINVSSLVLFGLGVALVWSARVRRDPGFDRTHLVLPVLIIFLLTNKVYSPQFSLWLVPWFAYSLPDFRIYMPYQLTEVGVFVTRYLWRLRLAKAAGATALARYSGVSLLTFQIAILIRTAALIACLIAWVSWSQLPRPEFELAPTHRELKAA
jgi:uncharacterized membrane protein